MARRTPFGFIEGPYYTYEIYRWVGPRFTEREFIYVGRGKGWRAKTYYRFLSRTGVNRYAAPKTHNPELDAVVAAVRATGRDIGIVAHDHGWNRAAAKRHEKALIAKHGCRRTNTGTLFNKNAGG
jgi:hypothetical protein